MGNFVKLFNKFGRLSYTDNQDRAIKESVDHPGLFIIDSADGKTFHTINTSREQLLRTNPPKGCTLTEQDYRELRKGKEVFAWHD